MKVSILCIGDELLKGVTINTNQAFIGQELLSMGVVAEHSLVVADEKQPLISALDYLFTTSDVVITTGGLGPTSDDITKEVVAKYLGRNLVQNQEALDKLNAYWAKRKELRDMPPHIVGQSMVIEGAEVLQNSQGSAPGMWITFNRGDERKFIVMLPGPPREMKPMFTEAVMPLLRQHNGSVSFNKLFYIAGQPESLVELKMQPVIEPLQDLSVAYCASYDGVKLFLRSDDEVAVEEAAGYAKEVFAENILPEGDIDLAADIVRIMNEKKLTMSTAESCTGGKIAGRITDIPGSSAIFPGAIVVYCNEWKQNELGVKTETLETFGAVSEECVTELVNNLVEKYSTDAGIAVSGIAGPGGAMETKPVGLVYIAVKFRDKCIVERYEFTGNRQAVRDRTVSKALNTLRQLLTE